MVCTTSKLLPLYIWYIICHGMNYKYTVAMVICHWYIIAMVHIYAYIYMHVLPTSIISSMLLLWLVLLEYYVNI